MSSYYNEIDPFAAEWLRKLIGKNLIAPGDVDERSIVDVGADDLKGYTQCHFFAGIGGWSYALRLAEWEDDRRVWTGSCPCQSFSAAGKGGGFDDPRHLWPKWFRLIAECRPATVFGEQVEAAVRHGWLDLVQGDLEGESYAVGSSVLGAHSVGAPHIRQRLYFCADAKHDGHDRPTTRPATVAHSHQQDERIPYRDCSIGELPDTDGRISRNGGLQRSGEQRLLTEDCGVGGPTNLPRDGWLEGRAKSTGQQGRYDDAECSRAGNSYNSLIPRLEGLSRDVREWRGPGWLDPGQARSIAEAGATRGFWGDCDWWYGRDEKYRPIGPGLFPLAHGVSKRVGRLRGYGNAIVPQVAAEFVRAYMDVDI